MKRKIIISITLFFYMHTLVAMESAAAIPEVVKKLTYQTWEKFTRLSYKTIVHSPFQTAFYTKDETNPSSESIGWFHQIEILALRENNPLRLLFEHADEVMKNRLQCSSSSNNCLQYKKLKSSLSNLELRDLDVYNSEWKGSFLHSHLMVAAAAGSVKATRLLLKKGVDVNFENSGCNALQACVIGLQQQLMNLDIVFTDLKDTQVIKDTISAYYHTVAQLVTYKAKSPRVISDKSPFLFASLCGFSSMVRLLAYYNDAYNEIDNLGRNYTYYSGPDCFPEIKKTLKELQEKIFKKDGAANLPFADYEAIAPLITNYTNAKTVLTYTPDNCTYFFRLPREINEEIKKFVLEIPYYPSKHLTAKTILH